MPTSGENDKPQLPKKAKQIQQHVVPRRSILEPYPNEQVYRGGDTHIFVASDGRVRVVVSRPGQPPRRIFPN